MGSRSFIYDVRGTMPYNGGKEEKGNKGKSKVGNKTRGKSAERGGLGVDGVDGGAGSNGVEAPSAAREAVVTEYPLFLTKGIDRRRFEYGVWMLNKNIEQVRTGSLHHLESLNYPCHLNAALKRSQCEPHGSLHNASQPSTPHEPVH